MATGTTEEPMAKETVRIEKVLPHPPRRVWRALTRPEALDRWLLPVAPGMRPERALDTPGEKVELRAAPSTRVSYEVTEAVPERRLSLWWTVAEREPTRVTWTLTPEQDGAATRLVIEHRPSPSLAAGAPRAAHLGGAMARLSVYLELGAILIATRRRHTTRTYTYHSRTMNREERKLSCR